MPIPSFLATASAAARAAGELLRREFGQVLNVNTFEAHDIKLELDVRTQTFITEQLLGAYPDHAIYGEEGIAGNQESEYQWIVDPIDGTVNFFYGIPHFCVSIALRRGEEIQVGVIYDPMCDELWEAALGQAPMLNGRPISVSQRAELGDCIVSVGLAKSRGTIADGVPLLTYYSERVRKCRLMGSAALDMAYVACGRLDAYLERSVSLWDVAAGWLLVEMAGGKCEVAPSKDAPDKIAVVASSGVIDVSVR